MGGWGREGAGEGRVGGGGGGGWGSQGVAQSMKLHALVRWCAPL